MDKVGFYIVTPVLDGGELREFLTKIVKEIGQDTVGFSEEMVVFYAI